MKKKMAKGFKIQLIFFVCGIVILLLGSETSHRILKIEFIKNFHDHISLSIFIVICLFSLFVSNKRNKRLIKEIEERKRAEKSLHHSYYLLRYIVENSNANLIILDNDLRHIYVSRVFLTTTGLEESQVIGKYHWELIQDLPLKWREVHLQALAGESLSCEEDFFVRADGTKEWTRWDCRPWYNEDDKIGGIILNFELITEKKKAEEALRIKDQMYQSLFHSNQVSILLWDAVSLVIVDANYAACQYYGYTHDQIIQKKISDINIYSYEDVFAEMEKAITEGCNHHHFKHRLSNNEIRNVEVYSGLIPIENTNMIYSLVFDVTERDRIQEELRETQERNEALLKANPDIMFILNQDGIFLDYHFGLNVSFSVSPDHFLNRKISEVFPEDLVNLVLPSLKNLFETGQIQTFNYQWRFAKELKYSIARLVLIGKNKALLIGSDITDREKANERIKLQASAMDAASDGLSIYDEKGRLIYVNKAFANIHGYFSSEELSGKSWRILYPEDEQHRMKNDIFPVLEKTGRFYARAFGRKKDGTTFPLSFSLTRLDNRQIICAVHDISKRIKAEEELINARTRAEESDRLKSAFLANMSHEIRTPMNGIIGFAGLLKEPDLSEDEKEEYLHLIIQSGERLLCIINDIVEISKIEAGMIEMRITQTNISDQLDYIAKFFRPEAEKKGLQLIVRNQLSLQESAVETDKEKLYAVLINLVKNAIKYSQQGIIEIGCEKRKNHFEFYVKDNGIGIPEERQKTVFDRFTQVHNGNKRTYEGNGLGLAIAKAYVEMMGGKIWLSSKSGKGSTFYFTISNENNSTNETMPEMNNKIIPMPYDIEILVVEDEPLSRKLLTKLLEPLSTNILYAGTGSEAVRICRTYKDLKIILMDIQMPDMDGYEATRLIREFNQEVIIIAQTAFALSHNREEALRAGCNDYISKPIKKEVLTGLILKYANGTGKYMDVYLNYE